MTRDFLRIVACGSVDDGKSTLIGRLLHDAGRVPGDERSTQPATPPVFPPLEKGGRGDLFLMLPASEEQIPLDPPFAKGEDKHLPSDTRDTR